MVLGVSGSAFPMGSLEQVSRRLLDNFRNPSAGGEIASAPADPAGPPIDGVIDSVSRSNAAPSTTEEGPELARPADLAEQARDLIIAEADLGIAVQANFTQSAALRLLG